MYSNRFPKLRSKRCLTRIWTVGRMVSFLRNVKKKKRENQRDQPTHRFANICCVKTFTRDADLVSAFPLGQRIHPLEPSSVRHDSQMFVNSFGHLFRCQNWFHAQFSSSFEAWKQKEPGMNVLYTFRVTNLSKNFPEIYSLGCGPINFTPAIELWRISQKLTDVILVLEKKNQVNCA